MFELILTVLDQNVVKEVNLHTEAPSMHQCVNDLPSIIDYMKEHTGTIIKWHCQKKGTQDL